MEERDKIESLLNKAFISFDQKNYIEAEKLYCKVLISAKDRFNELYKQALYGLGFTKTLSKQYKKARECYFKLLSYAIEEENKEDESILYHQLCMVEREAGNYDIALQYLKKEYDLILKVFKDKNMYLSANYYENGYINLLKGDCNKAKVLLEKSLYYAEKSEDKVCIACAFRGLGEVYISKKETNKALEYLNKSEEVFKYLGDDIGAREVEGLKEKLV